MYKIGRKNSQFSLQD